MATTDGHELVTDCDVLPSMSDPDYIVDRSRSDLIQAAVSSRAFGGVCGTELTEDQCDVYGGHPRGMTSGRLTARFLSRFRWYYPRRTGPRRADEPSLDAAWAHYEHWTLARYYLDGPESKSEFDPKHSKGAEPARWHRLMAPRGEADRPTALYPIWKTPVKELSEFGVSVRMYFSTLRALTIFMILAGVLHLPLMGYFWFYGTKGGIWWVVMGSAVCDDTEWVECRSCNEDQYSDMYPPYRIDGQYARKNVCNFQDWLVPGLLGYVSTVVLLASFGVWFYLQGRAEVLFDEDVQTASDYSVKVTNPPPDAMDPEEWKVFMERFAPGSVVACTVALDNRDLIVSLIKRRRMLNDLAKSLPYETDMADDAAVAEAVREATMASIGWWSKTAFFRRPEKRYSKLKDLEEKIRVQTQRNYHAVAVFVTFQREREQRNVLHALSTGRMNVWLNKLDTSKMGGNSKTITVYESAVNVRDSMAIFMSTSDLVNTSLSDLIKGEEEKEAHTIHLGSDDTMRVLLFRSQKVLNVKEAPEPNDLQWTNLHVPKITQIMSFVGTTLALLAFIYCSYCIIDHLERRQPYKTKCAFFIAGTNAVIPEICEIINGFEPHSTQAAQQSSLYVKIAVFRWWNSAIALSIVFRFIETISIEDGNEEERQSLTYSVAPVILAELLMNPIIKLMDPVGTMKRHVLAPRATDQHEMNSHFVGRKLDLANLYTDTTKVVFVALFFAAIYPPSLLLGALALALHFAVDKYALLRLKGPTPDVGQHLARLSRNFFFSTALLSHVIMGAYWWSGYPYDHICGDADGGYYHCSQDFMKQGVFPPLPRYQPEGEEWMTSSQETLTSLYSWTGLAVLVYATLAFLRKMVLPAIAGLFRSTYTPDGRDQNLKFTDVKHRQEVHGYVPQNHEPGFSHPLLACDLRGVDEDLIGWRDHQHGYSFHNLYDDACAILGGRPFNPAFSIVRQWDQRKAPPERKMELASYRCPVLV
mmetsp:Transcript_37390/g.112020  ORF Transcript_37390/g.112020 Transcript_37390/m.112020 type:complete len:983 (-) Transcript_37390:2665-5613(-)